MLSRVLMRRFASADEIAQRTFARFTKKYNEHAASFAQKKAEDKEALKKPEGRAYHHPYASKFRPVHVSTSVDGRLLSEAMGPELVSPHYENFMMSRRQALLMFGVLAVISGLMTTVDISFMMRSTFLPWLLYMSSAYWMIEGKKSLFKPLLLRFYRRITEHEVTNVTQHFKENTEALVRQQMLKAKSQLEYRMVYEDYASIRKDILIKFLINEELTLKQHLNYRANTILSQVEGLEKANQRKLLNKIVEDAYKAIDKALTDNKEAIEAGMFESALKGIEKGRMQFESDPVLPFVLKALEQNVKYFSSMSSEQQRKLISLTTEQLEAIRLNDSRLKKEFLESQPKIDPALKANPVVAKQLASWGK